MPDDSPISRQAFDEAAARLGITGADAHMDDLYNQLRGVLAGTASLHSLDVSGTEPDMAFIPSPDKSSPLGEG
jgi:hypothetical protein